MRALQNKLLPMIGEIQPLRVREVSNLRVIHKIFLNRLKNNYKKDILGHISNETVVSSPFYKGGYVKTTDTNVFHTLEAFKNTTLVERYGRRGSIINEDPIRKKNNLTLNREQSGCVKINLYCFVPKKVNDIVKLLHSIDYVGGEKIYRCWFDVAKDVSYSQEWFTIADLTTDTGNNFNNNQGVDALGFNDLFERDTSNMVYKYRISDNGMKFFNTWKQISEVFV